MQKGSNFLGVILVTVVVGALIMTITGTNLFSIGSDSESILQRQSTAEKKQADFVVAGWIPEWAGQSGLESVQTNSEILTNISPVWYDANEDGTLTDKRPKESARILREAQENGIEVTVTISLFSHEILTSIYSDPVRLQTHIDSLIEVGSQEGVDGIDINYESTKLSDKEGYFAMLEGIYTGLSERGKKTVVTVLPQWGLSEYLSLKETRAVQEWSRIAQYADEIRVMAYDFTWQSAPNSGPIGPLNWHREIIEYGISQVDPQKLVLGIHLYSYEKFIEKEEPGPYQSDQLRFVTSLEENRGEPNQSRAYTYSTIQKIYAENEILTDEEYQGERIIRYSKFNTDTSLFEDRITVYIDPDGVQSRIDLANEYNLKGVAFWRLGGEGELVRNLENSK
jgi:spore germination protein